MKGLFITFEGGEGAGKTTLIQQIQERLASSFDVVRTREPGGTKLGEQVREILLHSKDYSISPRAELALFLASRSQHVQEVILPAIESGRVVLCDRFNDSSFAYQGIARGLGFDAIEPICDFMSQGVQPDLTFYLDLDPNVGFGRIDQNSLDRIESEGIDFHQKVRKAYHFLAARYPERLHILNATLSPKEVFASAMKLIEKVTVKN